MASASRPKSITCPTLLIYGESDTAIAPESSRGVAAYLGAETRVAARRRPLGARFSARQVLQICAVQLDGWMRRCFSEAESNGN